MLFSLNCICLERGLSFYTVCFQRCLDMHKVHPWDSGQRLTSVCAVLARLCHQRSTEALACCEHDDSSALPVSVIAPALFSLKPILVNRVFKSICSYRKRNEKCGY